MLLLSLGKPMITETVPLYEKFFAKVTYKGKKFPMVIITNTMPFSEIKYLLRGLFMHAKIAVEVERGEGMIDLGDFIPRVIVIATTKPYIEVASFDRGMENRFVYYDGTDFWGFNPEIKKYVKVHGKERILSKIRAIHDGAPFVGEEEIVVG
jgi:hypothetical protein